MDSTLAYLLKEYKDRMTMLQDAVVRGQCAGIEEYRYICGQLRGLEAACVVIEDLTKKMEDSDE
jgi:hypothetical protein